MKKTATYTFPPPPPLTPWLFRIFLNLEAWKCHFRHSAHKIELKYDSQGHNVLCNVAFNGSRII